MYSGRLYETNDLLNWIESSWDYDSEASRSSIKPYLLSVNFADDLMNPIDMSVMQRVVPRVSLGPFVEVLESESAYGKLAREHPEVWKKHVAYIMQSVSSE